MLLKFLRSHTKTFSVGTLGAMLACSQVVFAQAPAEVKDYANHVLPVLRANCLACHNTQKAEGGLNLESYDKLS